MRRMYFIGVTTAHSLIHGIFPRWAALAGIRDAALAGIDIPLDAPPEAHRRAVATIKDDPEAWGGLVTTHKVSVYAHARDLFTDFDADAERLGEVNCIVRRERSLAGLATDTLTSGLALRAILSEVPFRASALILGAGGAAMALAVHLYRAHQPEQVILTDVSVARLAQVRGLTPARCVLVQGPSENSRLLEAMPAGSLVVNATGMGKDRPGSPVSEHAAFPEGATAWDFNYRGDLLFLNYARRQGVRAVDGWEYFLHGWSQIMSRVFGFDLDPALREALFAAASAGLPSRVVR